MNKQSMPVSLALILCPPLWAALPPAGLAYLAESALGAGIPVHIHDLNARLFAKMDKQKRRDWTVNIHYTKAGFYNACCRQFPGFKEQLLTSLCKQKITHIGFSVFKSNRAFSLALTRWLKTKLPRCTFIFGGPEVFSMHTEGLPEDSCIDHYVIGAGENALLNILAGNQTKMHTLCEQAGNHLPPPWPRYKSFDLSLYSRTPSLPVVASRGCPNHCRFCSERLLFSKYTSRKAEEIFREIHYHYNTNSTRHFIFYDSLFNAHPRRMEQLLDLILEAGLNLSWEAQICIRRDMSPGLFGKMKKSGCVNLFIGLESGSESLLRKMNKPFRPSVAIAFLKQLAAAGLQSEISLIAHYPGETEAEFEQTLDFIKTNRQIIKKIAQVSRFRPYPGTNVPIPVDYNPDGALEKINRLVACFREQGIMFTRSYIDNLI